MVAIELYSYYRSSCSWRVRLALELKGLEYRLIAVNLLAGEHRSAEYLKINPSGAVPALKVRDDNDFLLTQSLAMLEYIEETYSSTRALLPEDPKTRALTRSLALIIAADTQPLQNLRVRRRVKELASLTEEAVDRDWMRFYIEAGLAVFEAALPDRCCQQKRFCIGDRVSFADLVLIPQLYNARRFGVDVGVMFPLLEAIENHFKDTFPNEYSRAHPDNQPDTPQQ
jgi:maleylacetoacetate isomerase